MSSWHVQQLKFAFGIGGFMSFYGVVGLLTWFGGQKLGLPVNTRIMVIVVLLLTLPLTLLIGYVATRRIKSKEEKAKKEAEEKAAEKAGEAGESGGQTGAKPTAPTGTYADLPQSTEEVVKFLKTSNLGESGQDGLYSLPWYIVAGTPKTGKSSLVIGSNLNFQTLPSQRQSELKILRPTRNVDWRVTSDAVFIDTAGRYQTEGGDEDEWNSLLETIRKNRAGRPLDGFLLTADAETILNADERQLEEIAKVLRARLDEAMQRLKVRFPVYLIFTHADAIEGFRDSFSTSKKEGETLVWGATIPLEKSENAHALFDEEFGLLHNSVMKRRLMRLSAPFPPVRQLRIFNFPLHFGSSRRKFATFVSALFRPNPFTENPFLRGFYFTAAPVSRSAQSQEAANLPQTVGQTYFTEKLFRDVILRDKDLVRTFLEQRQKPPLLGWALTIMGAMLALCWLILSAVSLYNNANLVDFASTQALSVLNTVKADVNRDPLTKNADEATSEINAIEKMRAIMVELDEYDRNGEPIKLGMGFYSGSRLYRERLLPIYYPAVGRRFMDPTRKKMEDEMRKFIASPPIKDASKLTPEEEKMLDRNYQMLKAYLMLTDQYKDKANETDIVEALKEYWFTESKLPESLRDDAENQLKFYAKQADRFEGPDKFPRFQPNGNLVSDVRNKLKVYPAYQRYYRRKVTEISKDIETKTITSVEQILQREGGVQGIVDGNYTVPGAYTLQGFKQMEKAIAVSGVEVSGCDWVVQEKCDVTAQVAEAIESPDAGKIRERYFRDYSDHWRNFAKSLKVRPFRKEGTTEQGKISAKEALTALSTESSPIKILLKEISKNTNLAAKPQLGWWETIKNWFSSQSLPTTGADSQVQRDFQALTPFVTGAKDKKAPIDDYRATIENVSSKYTRLSDDGKLPELTAKSEEDRNKELALNTATESVNSATKGFKDLPFVTDLLKQPIENLKALFGADTLKQLAEKWKTDVIPFARNAEQGYPFENLETNADFDNLSKYLANGQGFSKFYDDNLKKYFDGTPGQLKPKDPNNMPFSQEFIDYVNKAMVLRQSLFSKGDTIKFSYNFELLNPKDAIVEMTIDGVTISSVDKPSSQIDFPAASGGGNGVIIKVLSTSETTSTSTTSANTSSSSVNTSSSSNSATSRFLQNNNSNSSSTGEKSFLGPWGLFRFMDAAEAKKESDNSYKLSYRLKNGKVVEAKVTPSGIDPFNKEIYKLRAPENILK